MQLSCQIKKMLWLFWLIEHFNFKLGMLSGAEIPFGLRIRERGDVSATPDANTLALSPQPSARMQLSRKQMIK